MRMSLAVSVALAVLCGVSSGGERFYNKNGSYAGRSSEFGNSTRFYDSRGAYSGRVVQNGGTSRFYDSRGAYVGRSDARRPAGRK